jgi:hypothetical protein
MHHILIVPDTLRHIIQNMPTVRTVKGNPIDAKRAEVKDSDIIQFYKNMSPLLDEIPAAFIFNVDETGCNEWTDKRDVTVLVPSSYEEDEIDVPIDRHSKRSTLTACISADGGTMKPFIIVDRKTLDDELTLLGYSPSTVQIVYQQHAFMTKQLFEQWASDIFFPTVYMKRLQYHYLDEALLIMDGFGAHETFTFTEHCKINKIKVIYLVPHSSHMTQPLDLVSFGSLKTGFISIKIDKGENTQTNKIIKMMRAWACSTTADLNVAAFAAAGFVTYLNKNDNRVYLRIDIQ